MKNKSRKKRNSKKKHEKLNENEIQMRLYGQNKIPAYEQDKTVGKYSEKDIKSKLYGEQVKAEGITAKEKGDLFENSNTLEKDIQGEIDALKLSIVELEEKLKKTESQKERLKLKLAQRKSLVNLKGRLNEFVLNWMPEKFMIGVIAVIVLVLFILIINLKPKVEEKVVVKEKIVQPEQSMVIIEPKQELVEPKKAVKIKPVPSTKKYTIQIAEYADELAADRFVENLKEQGYLVSVDTIYRGKKRNRPYFKINVGAFDSFGEAKKFNEQFRKKTNIKDSFIKERH